MSKNHISDRRSFLLGAIRNLGMAGVGGVLWGGFIDASKGSPPMLRPPAAVAEDRFLAKCVKCGLCVEACPSKALLLAAPGSRRPVGTPYLLPRENPCRMCRDAPCVSACPSGALDPSLLRERDETGAERLEINRARIGLAVIDRETCLAHWGIQCDACYRTCPRMDKAMTLELSRNERTGKHAVLAPVVRSDSCTGCGMCEHACVTKKASIFVLPRELALGEASPHYRKAWDRNDEGVTKDIPRETTTRTGRSEKAAVDYLNDGDL